MYNPESLKAEEFISHEEIQETLDYAEKNKESRELIRLTRKYASLLREKAEQIL